MSEDERTTTGIFGLDDLLQGGYPKGKVILEGPSSEERSAFSLSFVAEGLKNGEHVLVVTSTISPTKVKMILRKLGVDVKKYERDGQLVTIDWYSHSTSDVHEIEEIGAVIKCPEDTLNLNEAFHKAYSRFPRDCERRALVDGLSSIIGRHNLDTAMLLANSLNAAFGDRQTTVLFVLDSEMHDSSTISNLAEGFDGWIEVKRIKGEGAVVGEISVHSMRGVDVPSGSLLFERADDDTLRMGGSGGRAVKPVDEGEVTELMDSLQDDSDNETTWFGLGTHYASENDYDKAHECFDAALEIRPDYVAAWIAKANLYIEQGKNDKALRCYQRALAPKPSTKEEPKGFEGVELGEEEEGERPCPECGKLVSVTDPFCLSCGGDIPVEAPKTKARTVEEALAVCEERIEDDPEDADAWFMKGLCLARMERYEESIDALNEATKLNLEYPGMWIVKAKVYSQLGDEKKAAVAIQRGLEFSRKDMDTVGATFECSICGEDVNVKADECPNCGARFKSLVEKPILEEDTEEPKLVGDLDAILKKWESELTELVSPKEEAKPEEDLAKPSATEEKARGVRKRKGLINGLFREKREAKSLRKPGVAGLRGRTNGLTNGFRGRTNGLTNGVRGRTNGLTNGVRGRTNGLTNGVRGRTNGLTNGVRGRTNGLTNGVRGRTNGLTNGVRGRTNGLTNGVRGRTNGLTNGVRGRTNGLTNGLIQEPEDKMAGQVNGLGRAIGVTNGLSYDIDGLKVSLADGLTNGNGLTNGFGARRFSKEAKIARWKIYVVPLFALALLSSPFFFAGSPSVSESVTINGDFSDWDKLLVTSMFPSGLDPNIDIVGASVEMTSNSAFFYLEVLGNMLQGNSAGNVGDAIHILIDSDRDYDTGYRARGLGADYQIEIVGNDGQISSSELHRFESSADHNDWNGWGSPTTIQAATSGEKLEVRLSRASLGADVESILVVYHTLSWTGDEDFSDYVLSETSGVLTVLQQSAITTETVSGSDQDLLKIEMSVVNHDVTLSSLEVEISGSILTNEVSSLRLVDSANQLLDQTLYSGNPARFEFDPLVLEEGVSTILTLRADIVGGSGKTLGAFVPSSASFGVGPDAATSVYVSSIYDVGYVDSTPQQMTIDGGFVDWANCTSQDEIGETTTQGDSDIDIMCFSETMNQGSLFAYFDVNGRMLAGTDIPQQSPMVRRQAPTSILDSDKDTVPNQDDLYPYDFNNDGISDPETSHDYDGDGLTDFPFGSDYWLNSTIPASFPTPYAGRNVTRYIGPIEKPPIHGDDIARIYIDADNSSSTGYVASDIGAEYLIEIWGVNGKLRYAGLMEFSGGYPGEWKWDKMATDVDVAFDSRRLETSVDASGLQLQPDYSVVFVTGNWKGGSDMTDGTSSRGLPNHGTRHYADANGGYGLVAPDGGTIDITIDGTIDEASETDWTTSANTDTYGSFIKTYVVYNATDLFVAVEVLNQTTGGGAIDDYAEIVFDTDHDGGSKPDTEDYQFKVSDPTASPTLTDSKGTGSGWDSAWDSSSWTASASNTDTYVTYEFRIPLEYVFGTSTPSGGDTSGFSVHVYNSSEPAYFYWPDETGSGEGSGRQNAPDDWGDLFYSRPGLVVNEVSPLTATEYVELFNDGDSIDINGLVLSDQDGFTWTRSPSLVVPNGVYLVLMAGSGTDDTDFSNGNGTLYIGTTEFTDAGDDVLLKYGGNDMGFDYMQYGSGGDIQSCPSDAASNNSWTGTLSAPSGTDSAGRDKSSADTDGSSDWDNTGGPDVSVKTRGHVNYLASLTVTGEDKTPSSVVQGENPVSMLKLTMSADYGWINVTGLDVNRTGTSTTETDVAEATLWEDTDGDGEFDIGTDAFLDAGTYDDTYYTFSFNFHVQSGNPENLLVVYNISNSANTGVTVGARIDGESNVTVPVFDSVASFSAIQSVNVTINGNELLVYGGDITPSVAFQSEDNIQMLNLTLSTEYASLTVTQIDVTLTGTGSNSDIDEAVLYDDVNEDGDYDAGTDTAIRAGMYSGGVYSFSSLSIGVSASSDEYLLVVYNISATAIHGRTIGAKIVDENDITVQSPDTVATLSSISSSDVPIKLSDIFVIEVTGEVYESTDGGKTFSNPGDAGADFVAICANRTNTDIYALMDDGSVYLSTDGAQTWDYRGDAFGVPANGVDMTIDSNDDIYVLRSTGVVYSSSDGGATFSTLGDSGGGSIGIEANYSNNDLYVVESDGDIQYSSNGGNNWNIRGDASSGSDVEDIAIDTAGYVYVLEESGEVYRSTNYGNSFSQLSDIGDLTYVGMTIDLTYDYIYVVASDGSVFLSIDDGTSWMLRSDIGTETDYEDITYVIIPEFSHMTFLLLAIIALPVSARVAAGRARKQKLVSCL